MWRDLDAVPRALVAEQTALDAEYEIVKTLRGDHPRAIALDRLRAR